MDSESLSAISRPGGSRKRVLSIGDRPAERKRHRVSSISGEYQTRFLEQSAAITPFNPERQSTERRRPRVSNISAEFQTQLLGGSTVITPHLDRLPSIRLDDEEFPLSNAPRRAAPLSRASSLASSLIMPISHSDTVGVAMHTLMRSASVSSFQSSGTMTPAVPELSARHFLRNTKVTIDFAAPTGDAPPMSWSSQNILFFTRGNRVHYRNMGTAADDVGQLCKLQDSRGALQVIECAGVDQPHAVAIGSSKGFVQIWDVAARKMTASWATKPLTCMRWNGPVLTVGSMKGTIRHFDTRVKDGAKMKEQARKATRHQARICTLSWNIEGKLLASGDSNGTVHCWDPRQTVPLDVGEFVQRRKKIQHEGAITALAWCPWQPKLLATGDSAPNGKGTIRVWSIDASSSLSNLSAPGLIAADAQVTSLHFSPICRELLSTHGPGPENTGPVAEGQNWSRPTIATASSVVVHGASSLRHVTGVPVAVGGVAGSALAPSGSRLVVAVPAEGKLKMWEVWGKKKDLRRQPSFLDRNSIR